MLFGDQQNTAEIEQTYAVMAEVVFGSGRVFNVGSADWSYGLDRDPEVQRLTSNVLRNYGCGRAEDSN